MPKRPRPDDDAAARPSPSGGGDDAPAASPPAADVADDVGDDIDAELEAELERELAAAEEEAVVAPDAPPSPPPHEGGGGRGGGDAAAPTGARAAVGARNRAVVRLLTDDQLDRYEAYRRSSIARPAVRRILMSATGGNPSPHAVLLVAGIAKLFVAELVEAATARAASAGASGPLTPSHLRAAYADLRAAGRVPDVRPPRRARVRL